MDALQQEILRVLIRGEKTTGAIMNALNDKGWKVSLRDVAAAVHDLEGNGVPRLPLENKPPRNSDSYRCEA